MFEKHCLNCSWVWDCFCDLNEPFIFIFNWFCDWLCDWLCGRVAFIGSLTKANLIIINKEGIKKIADIKKAFNDSELEALAQDIKPSW